MSENERNLTLVHSAQEKKSVPPNVTSPIRKMLLDYRKEKAKDKFRIWDLFKNQ